MTMAHPAELLRCRAGDHWSVKTGAPLIGDWTGAWKADDCSDKFSDAILALVNTKVEAGDTATVTMLDDAPSAARVNSNIDLADLLAKGVAKLKLKLGRSTRGQRPQ